MLRIFVLCICFISPFLVFGNVTIEESLSTKENQEHIRLQPQTNEQEFSIDELLGPKDNFPFLPDNHRDSGTGKFNSF